VKKIESDSTTSTSTTTTGPAASTAAPASSGTECVAIAPYKANGNGQISFEVGDSIFVLAKLQAGWWSGRHGTTGESGVFPGSYVKEKSDTSNAQSSTSGFKVKVLHDFNATGPNQLSIKTGNIVHVTKELQKGWWYGELDGVNGIFPASYTKKLEDTPPTTSAVPSKTLCVAIYDFAGGDPKKLNFSKGDKFYLIKEHDRGWSSGEKDGKVGIFPTSYVTLLPNDHLNAPTTVTLPNNNQAPPFNDNHSAPAEPEIKSLPPPSATTSNRGRPPPQQQPAPEKTEPGSFPNSEAPC